MASRFGGPRRIAAVLAAILVMSCLAAPARAAEWIELQVGALILKSPISLEAQARELARQARPVLPLLQRDLGIEAVAPYRIVLIPPGPLTDPELRRLDGLAPPWAAGFMNGALRLGGIRVALAGQYPHDDLLSVLVHECVHQLLHDAAGGRLPRWFGEGVASRAERTWGLRDFLVYSSSLIGGRLPGLAQMDRAFVSSGSRARVAYAASFDFVSWTVRRHGDDVIRRIVAGASGMPFEEAWREATGTSLHREAAEWRRRSLLRYRWVPLLTSTTPLWIAIAALTLVAAARRRARSRAILESWEREEGVGPGDSGQRGLR